MIYNLIIYLYLLGVAIYSRFNEKVRKMWRGEREAFRILREKVDPNAKYVWFHAASLGVQAMRYAKTTKAQISSHICH